jgi:hypothetical protein
MFVVKDRKPLVNELIFDASQLRQQFLVRYRDDVAARRPFNGTELKVSNLGVTISHELKPVTVSPFGKCVKALCPSSEKVLFPKVP